jgi:hypothetical protein
MEIVVAMIQTRLNESALIIEYCGRVQRVITMDLQKTPVVKALREETNQMVTHAYYTDEQICQWIHPVLPKEQFDQIYVNLTVYQKELREAETLPANILSVIRKRACEPPVPEDFLLG